MTQDPKLLPETGRPVTPVALWKTKSFWFSLFPAVLAFIDTVFQIVDSPAAVPVGNSIALVLSAFGLDVTGEQIANFILGVMPLAVAFGLYQRRGVNQPYTMNPAKEAEIVAVVKDGTQAFQQGQAAGKVLKNMIRR